MELEKNLNCFLRNTAKDYDWDIEIVTHLYWITMSSETKNFYNELEEYLQSYKD